MTRHVELDLDEDEILAIMRGLQLSITYKKTLSRKQRESIWNTLRESLSEPYKNSISELYSDYWDDQRDSGYSR